MNSNTEVVDDEQRGRRQLVAATTKIRIKEMNEWRYEGGVSGDTMRVGRKVLSSRQSYLKRL